MLQLHSKVPSPFVCWACVARGVSGRQPPLRARAFVARPKNHGAPTTSRPCSRPFATVQHDGPNKAGKAPEPSGTQATIRARLRQWELENPQDELDTWDDAVTELGAAGNDVARPASWHRAAIDPTGGREVLLSESLVGGADTEHDQPLSCLLQPGDLLEVSTDSRRGQLLAVCVGRINGVDHFYASNGWWFAITTAMYVDFAVPAFAAPDEYEPVCTALPSEARGADPNELHRLLTANELRDVGPTREVGAALLAKMHDFTARAGTVRQRHSDALGRLHEAALTSGRDLVTAAELARLVLPQSPDAAATDVDPAAVYAVFSAMKADSMCFHPVSISNRHGSNCLFEVTSRDDVACIRQVERMVRDFVAESARMGPGGWGQMELKKSRLGRFLRKARACIDWTRELRGDPTPVGVLAPLPPPSPGAAETRLRADEEDSRRLVRFMELWAAKDRFTRGSPIHTLGSTILRAVDRYRHVEYLDRATGWLFLQEIGWILPWDVPKRHVLAPPGVEARRVGGLTGKPQTMTAAELDADCCPPGSRRDWDGSRIFCVDQADAGDIDDAMSVERVVGDPEGHYWIHVHVADPTSALSPKHPLARYAARLAETAYLPGNFERMLPDDGLRDRFSLAPHSRCLTFSAKIDEADPSKLLDHAVTPGLLGRRVIYITPAEALTAAGVDPAHHDLGPPPPAKAQSLRVGGSANAVVAGDGEPLDRQITIATDEPVQRHMSTADELSEEERRDLALLHRLSEAVHNARLAAGAHPGGHGGKMGSDVDFAGAHIVAQARDGTLVTTGQPSIEVRSQVLSWSSNLVAVPMTLAGVVAATWCSARGVPIPYRTMPQAELNKDLLMPFARDVIYPKLRAGETPSRREWVHFTLLLGAARTSVDPGPYFLMALDRYVKATSPLRRYGDLVVHWQVHAALAEERRTGRSLADSDAGGPPPGSLPFSRRELDEEVLPRLAASEQAAQSLSRRHFPREYALQAMARAWRFGEAPLPDTFRFEVYRAGLRRPVFGVLPGYFNLFAWMHQHDFADTPWCTADLRVGDVFEVRLASVDNFGGLLRVEPVHRIEEAPVNA